MASHAARFGVLLAAGLPLLAAAEIYRWVDESGVTVYSQWPGPASAAQRIETQPGPSEAQQAAAEQRMQRQIEQVQDATEQRSAAEAERAEAAALQAQRAANCTAARNNLETLENLGPRMIRKPDGSYVRMTGSEVADGISTARRQVEEYCD